MNALLLTGPPGIGKTTVVRRVAAGLAGGKIAGFTTEEIRVGEQRVGFKLETFAGQSAVFAHVKIRSPHRVSKYGVDIGVLEEIAGSALDPGAGAEVYLIDEIGKMECLSARFVAAVERLLDSGKPLVATIAAGGCPSICRRGTLRSPAPPRGGGLIERSKSRPDVELWKVTRENRESLPEKVLAWLAAATGSSKDQPASQ